MRVMPKRWFAVVVKPRHEKLVATTLRDLNLETLLPEIRVQRRWSDRMKSLTLPLFPGYVFCQCDFDSRLAVLQAPGVREFVSFGNGPATVDDEEINAIRRIAASGLPAFHGPYMAAGQKVRIIDGPLCGLVGLLAQDTDVMRVVVNVEILQRSVAVEVDRSMISSFAAMSRSVA